MEFVSGTHCCNYEDCHSKLQAKILAEEPGQLRGIEGRHPLWGRRTPPHTQALNRGVGYGKGPAAAAVCTAAPLLGVALRCSAAVKAWRTRSTVVVGSDSMRQ